MRILGLDFGSKTVGVAISDPLLVIAQSKEIIRREKENKLRKTLARIEEIIVENEVDKIVLGLPKNMDDSCGERVEKTLEFKEMLERRTGLEVLLWPDTCAKPSERHPGKTAARKHRLFPDKPAAPEAWYNPDRYTPHSSHNY